MSLMPKKLYLAGPIFGCKDHEAKDWRRMICKMLPDGWEAHDPMTRDYRGREADPIVIAQIVTYDKTAIGNCDAVIVNARRPSWGTAMEVHVAWSHGKRVISVVQDSRTVSPWLAYHSTVITDSWSEAALLIEPMRC